MTLRFYHRIAKDGDHFAKWNSELVKLEYPISREPEFKDCAVRFDCTAQS